MGVARYFFRSAMTGNSHYFLLGAAFFCQTSGSSLAKTVQRTIRDTCFEAPLLETITDTVRRIASTMFAHQERKVSGLGVIDYILKLGNDRDR